jgi:hypothetical protein
MIFGWSSDEDMGNSHIVDSDFRCMDDPITTFTWNHWLRVGVLVPGLMFTWTDVGWKWYLQRTAMFSPTMLLSMIEDSESPGVWRLTFIDAKGNIGWTHSLNTTPPDFKVM